MRKKPQNLKQIGPYNASKSLSLSLSLNLDLYMSK
jgi:hypothetical protein